MVDESMEKQVETESSNIIQISTEDNPKKANTDSTVLPQENSSTDNGITEIKTLDRLFTHEHVASISRMYALYCQVEKEKTLQKKIEFKKIVYFAQKKHSFDLEIDSRRISWETTNCIGLALISCRAVVDLNPFSTINSRLVDEFGATCLSMDKTNKNNETPLPMHVTYDSDPIAAEAAARMWYPKYTFKKIIDAVKRTVALEYVEQGQMGELAARLIVLNAIDMAISDSNGDKIEGFCYLKQITVREFLVRFIDVDVIESIEKNRTDKNSRNELNKFLNGIILCNHFIPSKLEGSYDGMQSKAELIEFAMRFGGRISTKPKSDIHIEIPVYLDQNDLTKLSYILIKVKTLNKRKFLSDWKDINQFWFEPKIIDRKFRLEMPFFLSIWMELLGDECETNNKVYFKNYLKHYVKNPVAVSPTSPELKPNYMSEYDWKCFQESEYVKEKQIFLYIRGINTKNYPALNEDLVSSLKDLACAKIDYKDINPRMPQEMKFLEKMGLFYN